MKSRYREWIDRRLEDIDAVENEDYEAAEISAPSGQTKKDHIIKLDTAKEMAMLERNEKGKQVRKYFIEIEKKYKKTFDPMTLLQTHPREFFGGFARAITQNTDEIAEVRQEFREFRDTMPLLGIDLDKLKNAKNHIVVALMGGKTAPAYKDRSLRSKVYSDLEGQLCREFGVGSQKEIHRNELDEALEIVKTYELPMVLRNQIGAMNAQLSMVWD